MTDLDAQSFLRGLDADPPLFEVRNGYLPSPMMARRKDGTVKDNFHLFETKAGGTQLRSETFAHYGALAELVLDYGWPREAIVSEPHGPPGVTKGTVDLIVQRDEATVIAVEAKGPEKLLRRLIHGMNECSGAAERGHTKSDHNKCLGLLAFRSPLFLAASCGPVRELYRVTSEERFVRLLAECDLSLIKA
ncbi:MAG: hypothetical protein ACJ768_04705 [Gaiellaceae bacterium]